jgi:hypothetical protein
MPRKKKTETLQEHALRLIREIRECPGPLCEHCLTILLEELEPLLKIADIKLPKKKVVR